MRRRATSGRSRSWSGCTRAGFTASFEYRPQQAGRGGCRRNDVHERDGAPRRLPPGSLLRDLDHAHRHERGAQDPQEAPGSSQRVIGRGDDGGRGGEILHPESIADWKDELPWLIERLPEGHRLVFVLRDVAGIGVEETSRALGISRLNVKVRLLRSATGRKLPPIRAPQASRSERIEGLPALTRAPGPWRDPR